MTDPKPDPIPAHRVRAASGVAGGSHTAPEPAAPSVPKPDAATSGPTKPGKGKTADPAAASAPAPTTVK